jgi:septum formation protein
MPKLMRPLKQAQLILASASPRRSQLLEQLGLRFVVDPSGIDETLEASWSPSQAVMTLARAKAEDVALRHPDADLVLGADTVVVFGAEILGKPLDATDAKRMLKQISGEWHAVFTGYTLVSPKDGEVIQSYARSDVRLRKLDDKEIEAYVATGEPLDKAGAYAIQELGTLLVAEIKGCYTNIVGLPLPAVDAAWRQLGWSLL